MCSVLFHVMQPFDKGQLLPPSWWPVIGEIIFPIFLPWQHHCWPGSYRQFWELWAKFSVVPSPPNIKVLAFYFYHAFGGPYIWGLGANCPVFPLPSKRPCCWHRHCFISSVHTLYIPDFVVQQIGEFHGLESRSLVLTKIYR